MGSWMEPNIHREHGGRISKELAEQLGVFDTATGLRRKPDGSLEILWPSDTPKEKEIVNHLGVEDVGGQIVIVHPDGTRHTFPDPDAARQYLHNQLGDNVTFQRNGMGYIASRA